LATTRTAGNQGWAWGRSSAVAGSGLGNRTRQILTLQGVANYAESNYLIDSFVDTAVATRYSGASRLISWFRNGSKSSPDTATGTPSLGGKLVVGALGPYASPTVDWLDQVSVLLVFDQPLSDDDTTRLTSSAFAPFQVFDDLSDDEVVSAAAADTSLSGSALASTAASGVLSTSVRLAAAAQATSVAAGALSSSINLSGAAQASASGAAELSSGIRLAGAIAVQSSASGQLQGAAVALRGGAYVQTSTGGALGTSISLAGMAAARSAAAGELSTVAGGTSPPTVVVDATKIPASRTVAFAGRARTVVFNGGIRTVLFAGGTRTVRF